MWHVKFPVKLNLDYDLPIYVDTIHAVQDPNTTTESLCNALLDGLTDKQFRDLLLDGFKYQLNNNNNFNSITNFYQAILQQQTSHNPSFKIVPKKEIRKSKNRSTTTNSTLYFLNHNISTPQKQKPKSIQTQTPQTPPMGG